MLSSVLQTCTNWLGIRSSGQAGKGLLLNLSLPPRRSEQEPVFIALPQAPKSTLSLNWADGTAFGRLKLNAALQQNRSEASTMLGRTLHHPGPLSSMLVPSVIRSAKGSKR